MACLEVNLSKHDQRVIKGPLVLDFKLYIDNECKQFTARCFKSCVQWWGRNGQVNSWHHSATWFMAVVMCHTELGPTVMGGAQTSWIRPRLNTIIFSHIWSTNETHWRQYIHVQWWYAGNCGIVVWAAVQGIHDSWDMPILCVCVCVCVCVRAPHINHRYGSWQGGISLRL